MHFVEIGVDEDHVHFLVQRVPMIRPKEIVQKIKSITGREIFKRHPEVKKTLWGGHFGQVNITSTQLDDMVMKKG